MIKTCIGCDGEIVRFWHGEKSYFAKTEIVSRLCDLYCAGLALLDWTDRNKYFADKIASGEIREASSELNQHETVDS